jgi:hypothetical protein
MPADVVSAMDSDADYPEVSKKLKKKKKLKRKLALS